MLVNSVKSGLLGHSKIERLEILHTYSPTSILSHIGTPVCWKIKRKILGNFEEKLMAIFPIFKILKVPKPVIGVG